MFSFEVDGWLEARIRAEAAEKGLRPEDYARQVIENALNTQESAEPDISSDSQSEDPSSR